MNHKKIYHKVITHHGSNVKRPGDERHHINPVSLGGKDTPDNWIYVTPRVHFILHQLLFRMTEGEDKRKMYYAVLLMGHSRQIKTGAHYQLLREQQGAKQTERMMGNVPWNKGKKGYKINQRPQKGIPKLHKRRPIMLDGVTYESCTAATKATGRSHYYLQTYGTYLN